MRSGSVASIGPLTRGESEVASSGRGTNNKNDRNNQAVKAKPKGRRRRTRRGGAKHKKRRGHDRHASVSVQAECLKAKDDASVAARAGMFFFFFFFFFFFCLVYRTSLWSKPSTMATRCTSHAKYQV